MSLPTQLPVAKILDLLLDAVCVVDETDTFVYLNPAFERIFGYSPEEMVGRPMMDMVHPEDRERTRLTIASVQAGELREGFENRYIRKDGRVVDIMWTARLAPDGRLRIGVARDVTERKRGERIQVALYAISEAAHAAEELTELFERLHRIIGGLMPARNFFVALHDPERGELTFPYHRDERDPAPGGPIPLDSAALTAEVVRTGRTLLITPANQGDLPPRLQTPLGAESLYWLGVPLLAQDQVLGALVVQSYSEATPYTESDQDLLQFVSTQAAAAIERTRLFGKLSHMAAHDALTGLANRMTLEERLRNALARARRDGSGFGLVFLDIDGFKAVNDRLGHAAGDELLKAIAARLRQSVRETDLVARLGGDEFVVLLERIQQPEHGAPVAEKIRRALASPLGMEGQAPPVSASIGLAVYPRDGTDERELMRKADEAMYAAKQAGGNRVETAGGPA